MQQNDSQLQRILDGVVLDDQPDPGYRQTLRQSILKRFDERQPAGKRLHLVQRKLVRYAAAAVVVLTAGATFWFMTMGKGPGIAFADVQRQLINAKTLTCILSVTGKAIVSVAPSKQVEKTLYVDKEGKVVKESVKEKALPEEKDATEDVFLKMKVTTKAPGRSRVDILAYNENESEVCDTYTITDTEKGKAAFFQTKQKIFIMDDVPKDAPLSSGFESVFRQCMDRITQADATPLGEKEIDGRNAKGYKFKGGEVWADAKTAEPILILIHDKDTQGNTNKIEISEIHINESLKDSLFSMDVPEGYVDLNNIKAEDLDKFKNGENQAVFILPSVTTEK